MARTVTVYIHRSKHGESAVITAGGVVHGVLWRSGPIKMPRLYQAMSDRSLAIELGAALESFLRQ